MNLCAALRDQARSCADLGSDFTAQLLNLLSHRLQPGTRLGDTLLDWPGDISSSGQSVPLRLAGALHRLVLRGQAPDLTAVYPPHSSTDDALWAAVAQAMQTHEVQVSDWLNSPPQTNEVRRAAPLIAAGQLLAQRFGLPIMLSELGASAGLNLNWDRFRLEIAGHSFGAPKASVVLKPDWTGPPPPPGTVTIAARRGVDLSPVDPDDPQDRLRLLSYIWPDQPGRMALSRDAMSLPRATVDAGDAVDWLGTRLPHQQDATLHLIYHTVAWQYFPPERQKTGRQLIQRAGRNATETRPLAWFSMETDTAGPGAALTLRIWPGNETIDLGRADFHGRWVDWQG